MVNLEYKGFKASVIYDEDDGIYHGKFEVINHLVIFESDTPESAVKEFHDAVDEYIEFCRDMVIGREHERGKKNPA